MVWFFNLLSCLPLPVLHRLGTIFGWLTYWSSARYAARLRENLKFGLNQKGASEADFQKVLRANISEAGKSILELPWVWRRSLDEVMTRVKQCHGWEYLEAARAQGKGCLLYTSPSPRDRTRSRMPSSA